MIILAVVQYQKKIQSNLCYENGLPLEWILRDLEFMILRKALHYEY